jgi:predicted Zn-dependent protease
MLLPLAESYFQAGKNEQAATFFQRLSEQKGDSGQARFRLAQIALKKGDNQGALNLFKELAEKGTDQLWSKLAREEAAILEMEQR